MDQNEVLELIRQAKPEYLTALELIRQAKREYATLLDLSFMKLTTLPPEIGQLTRLTALFLSGNQLTALPSEIGQFNELTILDISNNQLTALPPEIIRLTQLTELDLSLNKLMALPPEIGQLSRLTALDLSGNKLMALPPEIGRLTRLTRLNLSSNQLTALPPEIARLTQLEQLFLHDNDPALGLPPEILGPTWRDVFIKKEKRASPSAILDYYFRTRREATQPLNQAKLVVIGDGEVGKTALVNLLVRGKKCTGKEKQTQRIAIVPWFVERQKNQRVRLNIWDFGGQEIMHATHQFFLTERTLYLVVIDARRGTHESRLEYWLKLIGSLAKDSPVIVVVNKIDEQRLKLDENTIRGKYGVNVRDFAYVSCETREGVEELTQKIRHFVLGLEHVDTKVPASWIAVKEKLETIKRPWLPYADYQELCRQEKITDPEHQRQLISFLHDLGVMLSFFKENVAETRVLQPEWVTRGVYAIVTSPQLADAKGVLRRAELSKLLPAKNYPATQRQFIVDMMRKFELCFPMASGGDHADHDAWLIPGQLDENRPARAELPLGALRFQYQYSVLPASIIARFIVRTFEQLDRVSRLYWRNGIVLEIDGAKATVIADVEDRRIDIAVTGEGATRRRSALTFVRTHFRTIHAGLTGMAPEEHVPLPNRPEIAVPYQMLLGLERNPKMAKPHPWWTGSEFINLEVEALLNGIETRENRMAEDEQHVARSKPLGEVFLSYAHKDDKWRDELLTMLAPPLRGKTLTLWHDGKLKPSQDWRREIEAALSRAKVGVLLVSKHFLASEFINNHELSFLIEAAAKARVKLSWLLVSDCLWDAEQFAKLQALHDVAKPVAAYRSGAARDKTLKQIAQGILDLAK